MDSQSNLPPKTTVGQKFSHKITEIMDILQNKEIPINDPDRKNKIDKLIIDFVMISTKKALNECLKEHKSVTDGSMLRFTEEEIISKCNDLILYTMKTIKELDFSVFNDSSTEWMSRTIRSLDNYIFLKIETEYFFENNVFTTSYCTEISNLMRIP